ncbi:MAG: hypothetical protein EOP90_04660 [Lysobacteraceae bacterium]|nr:MAG: hypothetical protein EOP90_04660 [Xanthomonadaceae bacterium]
MIDDSGTDFVTAPAACSDASDPRATRDGPDGRLQRIDPLQVVDALPRLGPVLWLERRAHAAARITTRAGHGVLMVEHPALAPLMRCASVTARCAVTPNGPREWLCFDDDAGATLAKMFLLPDSDYLAWDEMTADRVTRACAPGPHWQPHAAFLRGAFARLGGAWRARVFAFQLRRLPWLRTLAARPPLRMSLFGFELARAIAADEGAELVSPLHAA